MADWRDNLITDDARIGELVRSAKRVAVVGIKTADRPEQPAYEVPEYLSHHGVEIVPVPVYYPDATEILGKKVYRKVADVPGPIDVVDVFRRPVDIPGHLEDILAKRPRAVWFQLGIRNDAAAETLAKAGILVVQDRCIKVEHRRHVG
ncbi:MAG TPA: CoA-binding protein [Anaeromyxobacteraceae bacterium]|nr:CoA-binding protein [Anaeromyxobacteraceae bacterium]